MHSMFQSAITINKTNCKELTQNLKLLFLVKMTQQVNLFEWLTFVQWCSHMAWVFVENKMSMYKMGGILMVVSLYKTVLNLINKPYTYSQYQSKGWSMIYDLSVIYNAINM